MKRSYLRLLALFGFLVLSGMAVSSCSTTGGARGAPVPSRQMAAWSNVRLDTLNIGYNVYTTHCTECHQDRTPVPPIGRPWHSQSLGLSLYHSLSDMERFGVQQYLKAADKSSFRTHSSSLR